LQLQLQSGDRAVRPVFRRFLVSPMPPKSAPPAASARAASAASAISIWPTFLTAHAVLVERVEARLAAAGLPPLSWYDVLWALERAEGGRMRLAGLAEKVVLSRSNMTRLIDRLEQAGLVRRERSAEDRRGAFAALTRDGAKVRAKMWPVYQRAIAELFDRHLAPGEAQGLDAALRRMLDAARALPRDAPEGE
jgi:DNA-binding MarR family transcriptional regulator